MAENNNVLNENSGAAVGQFRLVQISSGDVFVTTGETDRPYGCSQATEATAADQNIPIDHGKRVKLTASGAIGKGVRIMPDAAGKIQAYSATADAVICGYALEAAAADGDVIECIFEVSGLPDPTA